MILNEKIKIWKAKDYVRSVSLFALSVFALTALFAVILLINSGGPTAFFKFFETKENISGSIYTVIALILLSAAVYLYFYAERRDFIYKGSNIIMIFLIIIVSLIACFFIGKYKLYARPFALCALLAVLIIDRRSAIFMNSVFCILMFLMDSVSGVGFAYTATEYTSLVIGFIAGIFSIFLVDGESSRLKVISMGFIISLPVLVCAFALDFTTEKRELIELIISSVGSGLLSVIIMTALLPFFESVFNVLTNYRLAELTDHNAKLIKKLNHDAPGTFNHTLTVATLAEACANAIGENPLLARACSYYHDIGKLKKPEYFKENQTDRNPLDELTPELCTDIIRSHAKDGVELIKKCHLPQVLADAAEQHHGTMPVKYFYAKALKFTDGELDINDFCYDGPKPQTKIVAIIMISDACEAKVRTIGNRNHENVDKAVKEIIEERMDADQFSECDVTMRDLDVIRNTITNTLAGVYHARVKYPKLKKGGKNVNS